jgi:hypothetical protein
LARLGALGKMIQSMLPQTQGTGITSTFGSVDDQATVIQSLKDLLEQWGIL